MKELKLTTVRSLATIRRGLVEGRLMVLRMGVLLGAAMGLPGCIQVSAPEEPIVIQLDINIRAEVLYRLAEDANNTIEDNDGIF